MSGRAGLQGGWGNADAHVRANESTRLRRMQYLEPNLTTRGRVLEIGCSTGYGSQFLPNNIHYLGLDYDPVIVDVAKEQNWGLSRGFLTADINTYPLGTYSTIVAFEVIEHLDNG